VIGGQFTTVSGVTRNRIARLETSGSLDVNFNPNANSDVYAVVVLGDGRIVARGAFTTMNGLSRTGLALLSSSGADGGISYTAGNAFSTNPLFVLSNRNVLVGGQMSSVNGVSRSFGAQLSFSGDAIYAPYGGQTTLAKYSVITLEKLAANAWAVTESNCS